MSDSIDRLRAALSDRYEIERELGEGGMATVYLAKDVRHERRVALKVLRPELAATIGPERFLQEVRVILQKAFARGASHSVAIHREPAFDGMWGYAPWDALLAPR